MKYTEVKYTAFYRKKRNGNIHRKVVTEYSSLYEVAKEFRANGLVFIKAFEGEASFERFDRWYQRNRK